MQVTPKSKIMNLLLPVTVCLAVMIAVSTIFMTQSVFMEISESFNVDIDLTRFAFSVASIFYAISFLLFGPAADRFDLGKISSFGMVCLAIGVFTAAVAESFIVFILSMAVIGTSASAVAASMFPYMVQIAPVKKQGLYLGSFVAASTAGMVIGRFLTGIMASIIGLKNSFLIIATTILIFSLTTIIVFNGRKINNAAPPHEKDSKSYLAALKVMVSPELLTLLMTGFFLFFGFLGMVTFLTFRLANAPFYFTSTEIGWISLAGLTALPGSPLSGVIAQKADTLKVMVASLCLCIISVQLMAQIPTTLSIFTGVLLLFSGVYFCQPLIFLLITQKVPEIYLGTASSFYVLFCIGGGSLSSVILGPVWELSGWSGVTLVCSCSLVVAILLCLKGKKVMRNGFIHL